MDVNRVTIIAMLATCQRCNGTELFMTGVEVNSKEELADEWMALYEKAGEEQCEACQAIGESEVVH